MASIAIVLSFDKIRDRRGKIANLRIASPAQGLGRPSSEVGSATKLRRALDNLPHGCLTRHHIAPSLRKSAACTSSDRPVLLFFLPFG